MVVLINVLLAGGFVFICLHLAEFGPLEVQSGLFHLKCLTEIKIQVLISGRNHGFLFRRESVIFLCMIRKLSFISG